MTHRVATSLPTSHLLWVALLCVAFASLLRIEHVHAQPPLLLNSFDSGDQGWRPAVGAPSSIYRASGGHPGGYIASDYALFLHESAPGVTFPSDLSPYIGGLFSFDVRTSDPAGVDFAFNFTDPWWGSGWWEVAIPEVTSDWTRVEIPFTRNGFRPSSSNYHYISFSSAAAGWNYFYIHQAGGAPTSLEVDNFSLVPGSRRDPPLFGPGSSQNNPEVPDVIVGGGFNFPAATDGAWQDPPLASGFTYTMSGDSLFTYILEFPSGFSDQFSVWVNGESIGIFSAWQEVDFTSYPNGGVASFTITGIEPLVDAEDPVAFPLRLGFNTPTASYSMHPVPEPSPSTLLFLGALTLMIWKLLDGHKQWHQRRLQRCLRAYASNWADWLAWHSLARRAWNIDCSCQRRDESKLRALNAATFHDCNPSVGGNRDVVPVLEDELCLA